MNRPGAAALSLGAVLAAGLIGAQFGPQTPRRAIWYARLRKPSYTPPGPVIGAAWGGLEALMSYAGYRLLRAPRNGARDLALSCWGTTLLGLAGWQAIFFGAERPGASTLAAGAMFGAAAAGAQAASRVDRQAAISLVPLAVWTGFATLLSEEIWRRNRS